MQTNQCCIDQRTCDAAAAGSGGEDSVAATALIFATHSAAFAVDRAWKNLFFKKIKPTGGERKKKKKKKKEKGRKLKIVMTSLSISEACMSRQHI